jgi:hypothetical protein
LGVAAAEADEAAAAVLAGGQRAVPICVFPGMPVSSACTMSVRFVVGALMWKSWFITAASSGLRTNLPVPADTLKINLGVPPSANPNRLGVLGGDLQGSRTAAGSPTT